MNKSRSFVEAAEGKNMCWIYDDPSNEELQVGIRYQCLLFYWQVSIQIVRKELWENNRDSGKIQRMHHSFSPLSTWIPLAQLFQMAVGGTRFLSMREVSSSGDWGIPRKRLGKGFPALGFMRSQWKRNYRGDQKGLGLQKSVDRSLGIYRRHWVPVCVCIYVCAWMDLVSLVFKRKGRAEKVNYFCYSPEYEKTRKDFSCCLPLSIPSAHKSRWWFNFHSFWEFVHRTVFTSKEGSRREPKGNNDSSEVAKQLAKKGTRSNGASGGDRWGFRQHHI